MQYSKLQMKPEHELVRFVIRYVTSSVSVNGRIVKQQSLLMKSTSYSTVSAHTQSKQHTQAALQSQLVSQI